MISYYTYKFLHLAGIFAILLSLGGLIVNRALSTAEDSPWRKHLAMVNGIAMVIVLVAGFGLLARLGVSWPWQGWVLVKVAVWVGVGAMLVLVNRLPQVGKLLWWASLALTSVAMYMAIFKPF